MKKLAYLLLLVVTIALVGCSEEKVDAPDITDTMQERVVIGDDSKSKEREQGAVDMTELEKHNMPTDCWVAFNGMVYDVTEFLGMNRDDTMKLGDYCGTSDSFQDAYVGMNSNDLAKMFETEAVIIGVLE